MKWCKCGEPLEWKKGGNGWYLVGKNGRPHYHLCKWFKKHGKTYDNYKAQAKKI